MHNAQVRLPAAANGGTAFHGRVLYAWSCEDNYFSAAHGTQLPPEQPLLNVISLSDPFFSSTNTWIGNPQARGHCGESLKAHKNTTVVLMAGRHTRC